MGAWVGERVRGWVRVRVGGVAAASGRLTRSRARPVRADQHCGEARGLRHARMPRGYLGARIVYRRGIPARYRAEHSRQRSPPGSLCCIASETRRARHDEGMGQRQPAVEARALLSMTLGGPGCARNGDSVAGTDRPQPEPAAKSDAQGVSSRSRSGSGSGDSAAGTDRPHLSLSRSLSLALSLSLSVRH